MSAAADAPKLNPTEEPRSDPGVAHEWKVQCEGICARIARLESQVELLLRRASEPARELNASASRASEPALDERTGRHIARPPPEEALNFPPEGIEPNGARNGGATSGKMRPGNGATAVDVISLRTMWDDAANIQLLEFLTGILMRAGWEVRRASQFVNGASLSPGLTLTASPALGRQKLSQTFGALSAAGFSLTLHLDAGLSPSETALCVGRHVEYPSVEARGNEFPPTAEVA